MAQISSSSRARIHGIASRRGVLLTLGVTFIAVILLSFAAIMLRNAESTEERIWEIASADRLASVDYALQNDLSRIYNLSGIAIWINSSDTQMNISKAFSQVDTNYGIFLSALNSFAYTISSTYPLATIDLSTFVGANNTVNITLLPFKSVSFFYQPPQSDLKQFPAQMKLYHDPNIASYTITLRQAAGGNPTSQFSTYGFDSSGAIVPFTINWIWANGTNISWSGNFDMNESYNPGSVSVANIPEANVTCRAGPQCTTSVYGELRIYAGVAPNDPAGRSSIYIVSNASDPIQVTLDIKVNAAFIGNKTLEAYAPRTVSVNYTSLGVSKAGSGTRIV